MSQTLTLSVTGMKCAGCEAGVKNTLLALSGVSCVTADHKQNLVSVEFEPQIITATQISQAIIASGFQVQ